MLPASTKSLLDEVTSLQLSDRADVLDTLIRRKAEQAVTQGVQGSEFALYGKTKLYYDHFEELSNQLWLEIRKICDDTHVSPYPGCELDVFDYWKQRLSGVYEENRGCIYALLGGRMPKPAFQDHRDRIEQRVKTDINVFFAKRKAQVEKERTIMTSNVYNLSGANSRVTHGNDSSVNTVNTTTIFQDLQSAANEVTDAELRAQLTTLIRQMEETAKTPGFLKAYNQFTSFLADHIQIAQAMAVYLPALKEFAPLFAS